MVYAEIYGSSLISQDKTILKNLGMQNLSQNKLLATQEQRNAAMGSSLPQPMRKRKSSKAGSKNTAAKGRHVEHHVVVQNNQQSSQEPQVKYDDSREQTPHSSANFRSDANASTKRGIIDTDMTNSREIDPQLSGPRTITSASN